MMIILPQNRFGHASSFQNTLLYVPNQVLLEVKITQPIFIKKSNKRQSLYPQIPQTRYKIKLDKKTKI